MGNYKVHCWIIESQCQHQYSERRFLVMTKIHTHIYACKLNVILKHVVLDHFVVKSEGCQSALSEAMEDSGDKNDLTGILRTSFREKLALVNLMTLATSSTGVS